MFYANTQTAAEKPGRDKIMAETVNQENNTAIEPQGERTFTQSEMNAIIQERVARERSKYTDYDMLKEKAGKYDAAEEANKTELQKMTERADKLQAQLDTMTKTANLRDMRAKVAKATGVPETLLSAETEEACTAQAKAILDFAKPQGYPVVKDGGEIVRKQAGSTREKFAQWFEQATK